ncbi:MAG: hypothetical protein GC204_16500 [Chloroflexi bacterium]|nr:hypothetical protein [Chloroflexota bacterium]
MAWRIHLSDRTIRRLDILSGKPTVLAAWTQANRVTFLDLKNGSQQGDRTIADVKTEDRRSEAWQAFVKSLTAPNGVYLPLVRAPQAAVALTADGQMRLYQSSASDLFLEINGKESRLEVDPKTVFIAVGLDRSLGLLAALDSAAKLHIYQQHIRVGVFETGLKIDEEFRPTLVLSQDGTTLFITDGRTIVLMDSGGRIRKRMDVHYRLGAINCSPDGHRFVASDLDDNVVRIYDGDLLPTHQRYAVDLLTEAKKSQLLASSALTSAAVGPLAINNKGVLAFAISGTVCVTSIARMKAHPKPA